MARSSLAAHCNQDSDIDTFFDAMAMAEADQSFPTQLISGDGFLNVSGIEDFMVNIKLAEIGYEYALVSIIGPQSSGKSTLLNHLFQTKFQTMNASIGRYQTTRGIWMARCVGIQPCTIVMDLEGCDGRERGEDDTLFEKKIALFAVSLSDIVLVNVWGNEIGRESPAFKRPLRTVFEVITTQLQKPRKSTLFFVIRDATETPLEFLEPSLQKDIEKIWNSVPKSEANQRTSLRQYFDIEVVAFSHYKYERNQFEREASAFRQRFFHSTAEGGLAGDRRNVVHASDFAISAQQIWKQIEENKNLDIPAHQVLVAHTRCDKIIEATSNDFKEDKRWCNLQDNACKMQIWDFGDQINLLIEHFCSRYDKEASHLDKGVTLEKRNKLKQDLVNIIGPAVQSMLKERRSEIAETFWIECNKALDKNQKSDVLALNRTASSATQKFDQQCDDKLANWDTCDVRQELQSKIDDYLSQSIAIFCEKELKQDLLDHLEELFKRPDKETWTKVRKLLREKESADQKLSLVLPYFRLDEKTVGDMHARVRGLERKLAHDAAIATAKHIEVLMRDRFMSIFCAAPFEIQYLEDKMINACTSTVELLSTMAATRFDDYPDDINETLRINLVDPIKKLSFAGEVADVSVIPLDVLESSTWDRVSPNTTTIISPIQCKSYWKDFVREMNPMITDYMENSTKENPSKRKSKAWIAIGVTISAMCRLVAALFGIYY